MTESPAGLFAMGCNDALDAYYAPSERPQSPVDVPAYPIDLLEITNAQYEQCVADGGCPAAHWDDGACFVIEGSIRVKGVLPQRFRQPQQPAVCVEWAQAQAFCQWRCPECRLCGEAEWEKAARGGCALYEGQECAQATPTFTWGNADPVPAATAEGAPVANLSDAAAKEAYGLPSAIEGYTDGFTDPAPVGSFAAGASVYGALDMVGNVWEWTADCWEPTLDNISASPAEASCPSGVRARRGGAWVSGVADGRAGTRADYGQTFSVDVVGFRCCR